MSLVRSQLAALREIEQQWPEANAVVIGATALGVAHLLMLSQGPTRWRTEQNALGRRLEMLEAGLTRTPGP